MAVLQQANTQLAQKQVHNVAPSSIQYQQPIEGIGGQHNEATFKAIADAIDIGAEVYQKMSDASVDLELKEEQARMVEHMNNQAVIRENGVGSVKPNALDPLIFKQEWGGAEGKVKFGDNQLTPFEVSDHLSERAKQIMQPSIDVANSNFLRDSQISFAKELKNRGLKNLKNDKAVSLENWQDQLSSMTNNAMYNGLVQNPGRYMELTTKYAEDRYEAFEKRVNKSIEVGNINAVDAEEELRTHKEDLALAIMQNHISFDSEKAYQKLKDGNWYKVKGVGIPARIRFDYMNREADRRKRLDTANNEIAFRADVDSGIESPYIVDEIEFVRNHYDLVNKKLIPKKEKVKEFADKHSIPFRNAEVYFQKKAVGQKHYKPGEGIDSKKFDVLIAESEKWYNNINRYSDSHPESPYQKAEKLGVISLMSDDQRKRYQQYRTSWWKVNLFADNYKSYTLKDLVKHKIELAEDLTNPVTGKWDKAYKTFLYLLRDKINPTIEVMRKNPQGFAREQLGINPEQKLDKKLEEDMKKLELFHDLKFDGNFETTEMKADDEDFFWGTDELNDEEKNNLTN